MPEVIVDALVPFRHRDQVLPPKYPPAAQSLSLYALPDEPDSGRVDNSGTDPPKTRAQAGGVSPLEFSAALLVPLSSVPKLGQCPVSHFCFLFFFLLHCIRLVFSFWLVADDYSISGMAGFEISQRAEIGIPGGIKYGGHHVCPVNRGMNTHITEREDRGGREVDQGVRFHPL